MKKSLPVFILVASIIFWMIVINSNHSKNVTITNTDVIISTKAVRTEKTSQLNTEKNNKQIEKTKSQDILVQDSIAPVWEQISVTDKALITGNPVDKIISNIKKENVKDSNVKDIPLSKENENLLEINKLTNRLLSMNKTTKAQEKNVSQKQYTQYPASLKPEEDKQVAKDKVDYYNRVQQNNVISLSSFQKKIYLLSNTLKPSNYIKTLKTESEVRRNQVRSIQLKKGESIWMVAKRAYGDGKKYLKILRANPQITLINAKRLQPGTFIRVPL